MQRPRRQRHRRHAGRRLHFDVTRVPAAPRLCASC